MTRLWIILAFVLLAATSSQAVISSEPNHTLLWNDFTGVTIVDSFAIATGPNGLVILARDPASGLYAEREHVFLLAEPKEHKRNDSVLAVATEVGVIYFFDLTALPSLPLLGIADVGTDFEDFTWDNDDLYVARGFDGLWRYQMSNYSNPMFVDSSMLGIHYMQAEIKGTELFALDDYNGILRYDRSGGGFGTFVDYLFLPFQVHSFVLADSAVAAAGNRAELLLGSFAGGAHLVDTVELIFPPDRIFATDTMIAAFTREAPTVDLVSLNSPKVYTASLAVEPDSLFGGSVFTRGGESHIMVPSIDGGLVEYNLDAMAVNPQPVRALARPGPVLDMVMFDGELYTGGAGNPIDRYLLAADGLPVFDTTYFPGIAGVRSLAQNGDTLLVLYGGLERIFLLDTKSDTLPFLRSVKPNGRYISDITYLPQAFDTLHAFYTEGRDMVELFSVDDSSGITLQSQISLVDPIVDAVVVDSLLVLASNKNGLVVFRIYNDLGLEFRRTLGLAFNPTHLVAHDGRMYAFIGNDLQVYGPGPGGLVFDTSIAVFRKVLDADIDGDLMYTIGPDGIAIFDVSGEVPQLVTEGGRAGFRIVAENNIVAVSDSVSLHLFHVPGIVTDIDEPLTLLPDRMELLPNYPNPFNPETTIRFVLPAKAEVRLSVLNILGQEVTVLADQEYAAGDHEIRWDATSRSGQRVASGVYFYRLTTDKATFTRKMLLLK